jgi:hypothetical protein
MTVNWHLRYASAPGTTTTFQWPIPGTPPVILPASNLSYDQGNVKDNNYSFVLRHNINSYLIHEAAYDFYIYNQPDIVYKMATFWLIRKSNTWKRIKFTTPLHKLNLETFDTVRLNFSHPYVASEPVLAIVEQAKYDSENNCIHFQCLTPVKAGTSVAYPWFWPADLPATETWPPPGEDAGIGGPGSGANGSLPVGDTSTINQVVFVGGTNVVFGGNTDIGDRSPQDTDFNAQTVVDDSQYTFSATQQPNLDLTVDFAETTDPIQWTFQNYWQPAVNATPDQAINVNTTFITDGTNYAPLSSVFQGVNSGKIMLSTTTVWTDGTNNVPFDFEFDTDGNKFGAGTAFLQQPSTEE